ncbi:MAG: hypothetical protein HC831_05560 [Chloroflexia bacterium]|nr:hypothetical protein [Chloroflexia bacterium]
MITLSLSFYFLLSSQEITKANFLYKTKSKLAYCLNDSDIAYWFCIRVKLNGRLKEYNLSVKSPILSGSLEKYDKSLWRNLQGGKLLVVGPFQTEKEAVTSRKVYLSAAKDISLDIPKEKGTLYWFKLKYAINKRRHSYILEAIHKVFSGTYLDFYSDVKQGLKEGTISIGPYKDFEYTKEMIEPKKTN